MKKKINSRLIGIALLAILVTLLGVTSIYYQLFKDQVRTDLSIFAEMLVDSAMFQKENIGQIQISAEEVRVTWVDEDGRVLYDNWTDEAMMENHLSRPEIAEALKDGVGKIVRRSDTLENNSYYYALRLEDGTVLRVAVRADSSMSIFLQSLPLVCIIISVIVFICIFVADFLTKSITTPIKTLTDNISQKGESSNQDKVYKELEPFVETIRLQHENILRSAKMRQDFTAAVSHELKTPLTAISGYAELIENQMVSPEQEVKFAGEIRKNSHRLLTQINDIIRLSELDNSQENVEMEPVELFALADECAQNLSINATKRGIAFTLAGEECIIQGNRDLLWELIENLCENAIRYNNEGGTVRLFVGKDGGKTVLIVEDDGIGIPKSQQKRVFERFYRVDKSRSRETGGTGLGLAIVKHIVGIHGATIHLESEVGTGTKIRVEF